MLAIVTRPSMKLGTILVQNHLHWEMYYMQTNMDHCQSTHAMEHCCHIGISLNTVLEASTVPFVHGELVREQDIRTFEQSVINNSQTTEFIKNTIKTP